MRNHSKNIQSRKQAAAIYAHQLGSMFGERILPSDDDLPHVVRALLNKRVPSRVRIITELADLLTDEGSEE
jgi:hypothetical protein